MLCSFLLTPSRLLVLCPPSPYFGLTAGLDLSITPLPSCLLPPASAAPVHSLWRRGRDDHLSSSSPHCPSSLHASCPYFKPRPSQWMGITSAPSRLPLFTVSGGGDVMTTSPRHHPTAPPPPRLLSLLQAPPITMDGAYSPLLQGSLMTNMSPSPSVIVITRAAPFCRLHLIFKVT